MDSRRKSHTNTDENHPFQKKERAFHSAPHGDRLKARSENHLIIAQTVGSVSTFSDSCLPAEIGIPEDTHPSFLQ